MFILPVSQTSPIYTTGCCNEISLEYATLMMEAAGFLGMLEHIYQTIQHHIPQAWLHMKLETK
jgi:hypothetical protein